MQACTRSKAVTEQWQLTGSHATDGQKDQQRDQRAACGGRHVFRQCVTVLQVSKTEETPLQVLCDRFLQGRIRCPAYHDIRGCQNEPVDDVIGIDFGIRSDCARVQTCGLY